MLTIDYAIRHQQVGNVDYSLWHLEKDDINNLKRIFKGIKGVSFDNPQGCYWFLASQMGEILGCCALVVYGDGTARYKSDMVLESCRGKGIYNQLFLMREELAKEEGVDEATAYCTQYSLNTFKRYGFRERGCRADGVTYVSKQL